MCLGHFFVAGLPREVVVFCWGALMIFVVPPKKIGGIKLLIKNVFE